MAGFTVDVNDLDSCRQTVGEQAGQFGGLGDGFAQSPAGGSSFGSMPASGRMSQLATQFSSAVASQYSSAETFLRGAERALDQARQNYTKADEVNASNARSV